MNSIVDWVTAHISDGIDRAIGWLNELNTTNLRLLVTVACVAATAAVYLALAVVHVVRTFVVGADIKAGPLWTPAVEWLGFLLSLAGVDTLHYFAKRKTWQNPNTTTVTDTTTVGNATTEHAVAGPTAPPAPGPDGGHT